jgi:N-carbamoyl-L-amino-acid hydrolase
VSDALSAGLPRPSAERLAGDLRALETFTRPERPYTRRAFSDEDRSARQWLAGRMVEAGRGPAVDAAGNQIGRRAGTLDAPRDSRKVLLEVLLRLDRDLA